MKRDIFELSAFRREINDLIKKKRLLREDFEAFKKFIVENPEFGDLIRGAGGVRKARLKGAGKGKSGGFRVCYYDDAEYEELYLMWIYAKSEQENLTPDEKKALKELVEEFKNQKRKK